MELRPIDIMKSQEASQYKHIESQRAQHEKVQFSKNFQDVILQEKKKTVKTSKSENKEFRYDAKDKGSSNYSGSGKKKNKQEDKSKELKEPKKTGGIDILI